MESDTRHSAGRRQRMKRGMVLGPLLGLALLAGSFPASAKHGGGGYSSSDGGYSSSEGTATYARPDQALEAPQWGRSAGKITGRRTH